MRLSHPINPRLAVQPPSDPHTRPRECRHIWTYLGRGRNRCYRCGLLIVVTAAGANT